MEIELYSAKNVVRKLCWVWKMYTQCVWSEFCRIRSQSGYINYIEPNLRQKWQHSVAKYTFPQWLHQHCRFSVQNETAIIASLYIQWLFIRWGNNIHDVDMHVTDNKQYMSKWLYSVVDCHHADSQTPKHNVHSAAITLAQLC